MLRPRRLPTNHPSVLDLQGFRASGLRVAWGYPARTVSGTSPPNIFSTAVPEDRIGCQRLLRGRFAYNTLRTRLYLLCGAGTHQNRPGDKRLAASEAGKECYDLRSSEVRQGIHAAHLAGICVVAS